LQFCRCRWKTKDYGSNRYGYKRIQTRWKSCHSNEIKTHVGMSKVTGIFYVYDDEGLAKKHINPTIFSRLEKTKAKIAEAEKATAEAEKAETPSEEEAPKTEEKTE